MGLSNKEMFEHVHTFLKGYSFESLPAEVISQACRVIMDTLGVMIRGSAEADASNLAKYYPETAAGATIFSPEFRRVDPQKAILVNSTMAAAQELTEGNRFSRGHFAVQTVPAVLAQAEVAGKNGQETVAAFVLAYEIAARIGMAMERHFYSYGHGMWAAPSASAGVAMLRGANPAEILECIKLGSNMAVAPAFETHFEGATVRNTTAGMGGVIAYMVPDLQACGYLGSEVAMGIVYGQIVGQSFSNDEFVKDLGQVYQITRNYFKFHASGRHMHPATDAMANALEQKPMQVEDIEKIDVYTYYPAAKMVQQDPINALTSKMSIPYSVAALTVLNETSADAYTPEAQGNPLLRDLMKRVTVHEDKNYSAKSSWGGAKEKAKRSARAEVTLKDGSVVTGYCENPTGDFDFPRPPGAVKEKFIKLAGSQLGVQAAERIWERGMKLPEEKDFSEFIRWISQQKS